MFHVLCILFLSLGLVWPALAQSIDPLVYDKRIEAETSTFARCDIFIESVRLHCERLAIARERAHDTALQTFECQVGSRRFPCREFVLIAYAPSTGLWHDILLGMPVHVGNDRTFQPSLRTKLTEGAVPYRVKRLRGQSLNKMAFEVFHGDEELLVYGAKHLLFGDVKLHSVWGGKTIPYQEVMYLSTPAHLVNPESATVGYLMLAEVTRRALAELREFGVESLAYPGRLVADTIPIDPPINLILAEQSDPCFLWDRPRSKECIRRIPVRPYPNNKMVREAVLTEFFVNGLSAFRYMRSEEDARGVLQFTNTPKGDYKGTYTMVRERYPRALLDPDFNQGTKGLVNMLKAAILLIDLELANRNLPNWARQLFLVDPELGFIFPGGAYHGGASEAVRLARLMQDFARKHKLPLRSDSFLWDEFSHFVETAASGIGPRTRGYVRKIIDNILHLNPDLRWPRPLPEVNVGGVLS